MLRYRWGQERLPRSPPSRRRDFSLAPPFLPRRIAAPMLPRQRRQHALHAAMFTPGYVADGAATAFDTAATTF